MTCSWSNFSFAALASSSDGMTNGLLSASMSSSSNARARARRVSRLATWPCSTRWIVRTLRPEIADNCSCDHCRISRNSLMQAASSVGVSRRDCWACSVALMERLLRSHSMWRSMGSQEQRQHDSNPTVGRHFRTIRVLCGSLQRIIQTVNQCVPAYRRRARGLRPALRAESQPFGADP